MENEEMAKKRTRGEPTPPEPISRELWRFQRLVVQLKEVHNIGQAEMARRTGIDSSHINRLLNAEKHGYTGLSADIVRKVRNGLNISADYFFDDYDDERPAMKLYSLDAKRQEAWRQGIEDAIHRLTQSDLEKAAQLLELQGALQRKDLEIDRLKYELEKASRSKQPRRS